MNTITTESAEQLEKARQSEDWTYQELAVNIRTTTNRYRNEDCWRKICLGKTAHPHRTTLNIIRDFLKHYTPGRGNGARRERKAS